MKKEKKRQLNKHSVQCASAMVMAIALALLPCNSFSALADVQPYDTDSSPDFSKDNYSIVAGLWADYKFDDQGNVIKVTIEDFNGSKYTADRTYNGNLLLSETIYEYDATWEYETTETTVYNENGHYTCTQTKYSSGTSFRDMSWYNINGNLLKSETIDFDGKTSHQEKTYDAEDRLLTSNIVHSSGDIIREEKKYDGDGELIYSSYYDYNASDRVHNLSQNQYGIDRENQISYNAKISVTDSGETKSEHWYGGSYHDKLKSVETSADGLITTEDYSYNSERKETLYTKTTSDDTMFRRETIYFETGSKIVETDNLGNIKIKTKIRDGNSGHTTLEEESRNADGSSDYQKEVRRDDYSTVYFFNSEKAADGTESYSETTYNADDSCITKTKDSDGTYSETKYDANRDNVSRVRTLPDGIVAVTTWEIGMNGEEKSERTHYSNGDEYIYNFEYNENGRIVKGSGTRNNGVSIIQQSEYTESDNKWTTTSLFNNGRQVICTTEETDQYNYIYTYSYSEGDVSKDIFGEKTDGSYYIKTVYRNGKTEEANLNLVNGVKNPEWKDKMTLFYQRYNDYISQGWDILPAQNEPVI